MSRLSTVTREERAIKTRHRPARVEPIDPVDQPAPELQPTPAPVVP